MKPLNYRSKSRRKVYRKSPGTHSIVHLQKKNPKGFHCGKTGDYLNGIPRMRVGKFNRLSKSKKRPNRPYGGTYSHKVVRLAVEKAVWASTK